MSKYADLANELREYIPVSRELATMAQNYNGMDAPDKTEMLEEAIKAAEKCDSLKKECKSLKKEKKALKKELKKLRKALENVSDKDFDDAAAAVSNHDDFEEPSDGDYEEDDEYER